MFSWVENSLAGSRTNRWFIGQDNKSRQNAIEFRHLSLVLDLSIGTKDVVSSGWVWFRQNVSWSDVPGQTLCPSHRITVATIGLPISDLTNLPGSLLAVRINLHEVMSQNVVDLRISMTYRLLQQSTETVEAQRHWRGMQSDSFKAPLQAKNSSLTYILSRRIYQFSKLQ